MRSLSILGIGLTAACSPSTLEDVRLVGEPALFNGQNAVAWALQSPDGTLSEVGITLGLDAVRTIETSAALYLELPEQGVAHTFFDHVVVNFEANGHPSEVYEVPHFDLHFYGVPLSEQLQVTCIDEPMPSADSLPPSYIIPSTAESPSGTCVPEMGVHALDFSAPELSPTDPAPFEHHLVIGFHDGELTFIEPMIAQEILQDEFGLTLPVPRPEVLGQSTEWPARWTLAMDPETSEIHIAFRDFSSIE